MSEMEMKDIQTEVAEEDLEKAAGGKIYVVQENMRMFCPYCKDEHNVSILKGTHWVDGEMMKLNRCNRSGLLFALNANRFVNQNGDVILYSEDLGRDR